MGSGNRESVYGAVIEAAAESEMRVGVALMGKGEGDGNCPAGMTSAGLGWRGMDRCSFLVHQSAEWHLKAWRAAPPAWIRQQLSPRGAEEKQVQQLQFQPPTKIGVQASIDRESFFVPRALPYRDPICPRTQSL
jgi:hypothetical protein